MRPCMCQQQAADKEAKQRGDQFVAIKLGTFASRCHLPQTISSRDCNNALRSRSRMSPPGVLADRALVAHTTEAVPVPPSLHAAKVYLDEVRIGAAWLDQPDSGVLMDRVGFLDLSA